MPNWVNNTIICKDSLLSKMINSERNVDFGILIPEPQTKEECRAYGEKYIDNNDKHLEHNDDREWFNWYDWRCDFWGTKWNAGETNIREEDGYYFVIFDTAWAPPQYWVEKLSKLGQPFILIWEEEQGFGEVECYNGKTNSLEKSWNINSYNEDDEYYPSTDQLKEFFGD